MANTLQQLILTYMLYAAVPELVYAGRHPCHDADTNRARLWPNGVVTYKTSKSLSKNISLAIEEEIQKWELHSCINFVPHASLDQRNFVLFKPGDRNCASVGRISNGRIEVLLSETVSTNRTALHVIFTRMIGVSNSTLLLHDSNWSHNQLTESHRRVKTKKSTITVAQWRNNSLCHKIKTCGYTLTINDDNKHIITSPGYPDGYENNLDCVWSIYNFDRRPLNITFKLATEKSFDFVKIIQTDEDGKIIQTDEDGNKIAWFRKLSGDVLQMITINGYKIVMWFHSDDYYSREGFAANITWAELPSTDECTIANGGCDHVCIPASERNSSTRMCRCNSGFELSADNQASCKDVNECKVDNGGCSQICTNTMGGYYCKCGLGYSLIPGPQATSCKSCQKTYTDQENVLIYSPDFPGIHTAHHNCLWKIKTTEPQFYMLSATSFHLIDSLNCSLGYLKITDKTNKLKIPRLCGLHHNKIEIVSRTAELTIHFKTKVRGGTGFHLRYQQVEKQQRYIQIDNKKVEGSTYDP